MIETLVMFVIEDEIHAEPQEGHFQTLEQAIAELKRRAAIAWNEKPNQPPCDDWKNCGRCYELVEYNADASDWKELSRTPILEISATGVRWLRAEP